MKKRTKQGRPWSFVRTKADVLRERRMQVERLEKRCTLSATPLAPAEVPLMDLPTPEGDLLQVVARGEPIATGDGGLPTAAGAPLAQLGRENLLASMETTRATNIDLATLDRLLAQPMDDRLGEWSGAILPVPNVAGRVAADGGPQIFAVCFGMPHDATSAFDGQEIGMGQFMGDMLAMGPGGDGTHQGFFVEFAVADSFHRILAGPEDGRPLFEAFDGRARGIRDALNVAVLAGGMTSSLAGALSTQSTLQDDSPWTGRETVSTSIMSWRSSQPMLAVRETASDSAASGGAIASVPVSSPGFGTTSEGLPGFTRMSDDDGVSLALLHLDGIAAKGTVSYHTRPAVVSHRGISEELGRELTVSLDMGQLDRGVSPVAVAASVSSGVALLDIGAPEAALQESSVLGGIDVRAAVRGQEIALDGGMAQAYAFSLDSVEEGQPVREGEAVAARSEATPPQAPIGSEESATDERSAMQSSKPVTGVDAASLLLAAAPLAAKRRRETQDPRSTSEL